MHNRTLTKILNQIKRIRSSFNIRIIITAVLMVFIAATAVFLVENGKKDSQINSYSDSLWYTVVTMSTTGYGDIVPKQPEGRLLGYFVIISGFVLTAVASGVIASLFVEKKLKEGKGLKNVKFKNHIVICGWNGYADSILDSIVLAGRGRRFDIALINELDEDAINRILGTHKDLNLQFVKGNFASDFSLKQANLPFATSAVILADTSGKTAQHNADERTILAAMAMKSLNPKIKISAQLTREENEEHLRRAEVEEIIVDGEFSGFLISNAALSPGIHQLVKELLTFSQGNTIIKTQIPRSMVGKTFG